MTQSLSAKPIVPFPRIERDDSSSRRSAPQPSECQPGSAAKKLDLEQPPEKVTVTRERVTDALVENIEIALGRRAVKLVLTVWRTEFGKKIPKHIEIEVSMRDGHAANVALKMLGKELGIFKGGSAPLTERQRQGVSLLDRRMRNIAERRQLLSGMRQRPLKTAILQ